MFANTKYLLVYSLRSKKSALHSVDFVYQYKRFNETLVCTLIHLFIMGMSSSHVPWCCVHLDHCSASFERKPWGTFSSEDAGSVLRSDCSVSLSVSSVCSTSTSGLRFGYFATWKIYILKFIIYQQEWTWIIPWKTENWRNRIRPSWKQRIFMKGMCKNTKNTC